MTFGAPSPSPFFMSPQAVPQGFDSSATPFGFGGFNYLPQQEPVSEDFAPSWDGAEMDAGFSGLGPDLSGMDPTFGNLGPDLSGEDPGFNPHGRQQRPQLIPELQDHDSLPEDGGPDHYPDYLEYLRQNNPWGDIGVKAAILARSFTNPEQATQWAIALKQHEAQRQFQAIQAQQQQDATERNIKLRAEYQKDQKKQTQMQQRISKVDAAVRSAKIDADSIASQLGWPPTEETIDQWERAVQQETSRLDAEKKVKDDKNKIIAQALKSNTEAPQFTEPTKKGYDPVFARNLAAANSIRSQKDADEKLRHDNLNKLNELRAELMKERIRVEKGTLTDVEKKELEAKYKELDLLASLAKEASTQASSVDLFAGNDEEGKPMWEAAQEKYNYFSGTAKQRMQELQEKIFEIKEYIGSSSKGAGIKSNPPRALPGTAGAPAATGAGAITGPQPSEKAIAKFKRMKANGTPLPQLTAAWQVQYPGAPVPE